MAKYKILYSKIFAKDFKKLNLKSQTLTNKILNKLANNEALEPKHKDHKLKVDLKDFRECHILPDLLLIYQKVDELLILNAFRVASHSELF